MSHDPRAASKLEALKSLGLLQAAPLSAATAFVAGKPARHALSGHPPLWRFCNPVYAENPDFFLGGRPVFAFHARGASLAEVLVTTSWINIIGAADSELTRQAFALKDTLCLVFEPDLDRFAAFAAGADLPALARTKPFFFAGDPERLGAPLLDILPEDMAAQGHPVFFVQDGYSPDDPCLARLIQTIELFYYRHRIYQLESHWGRAGLPSREIKRGLFYDQQLHLYQNCVHYLTKGSIAELENAFPGQTALVAAGGPDLDARIGYIRENRDKAVVICVNSALRSLLAAGITPHFVVINDTSIESGRTLAGLGRLPDVSLVAHAASDIAGDTFGRVYFFGNILPEVYPVVPALRLHGSVAGTAYSLARHFGCARVVLAGVQMAGSNPWALSYTRQAVQAGELHPHDAPPTDAFPQLCPVMAASGQRMYTTLNFLDAARWMIDEFARYDVEVINLCPDSIVCGGGIAVDPDYPIPAGGDIQAMCRAAAPRPLQADPAKARAFILSDIEFWRGLRKVTEEARRVSNQPHFPEEFAKLLAACDQNGVSFLLERLPGFDIIPNFNHYYYMDDAPPVARNSARIAYINAAQEMARGFIRELTGRLKELTVLTGEKA